MQFVIGEIRKNMEKDTKQRTRRSVLAKLI